MGCECYRSGAGEPFGRLNRTTTHFRKGRVGTYNAYTLNFTRDLAANASPQLRAMAEARGQEIPALPGLSFGFNTEAPTADQAEDESIVCRTHIAVSPMQAGYEYHEGAEEFVPWQLADLFSDPAD